MFGTTCVCVCRCTSQTQRTPVYLAANEALQGFAACLCCCSGIWGCPWSSPLPGCFVDLPCEAHPRLSTAVVLCQYHITAASAAAFMPCYSRELQALMNLVVKWLTISVEDEIALSALCCLSYYPLTRLVSRNSAYHHLAMSEAACPLTLVFDEVKRDRDRMLQCLLPHPSLQTNLLRSRALSSIDPLMSISP